MILNFFLHIVLLVYEVYTHWNHWVAGGRCWTSEFGFNFIEFFLLFLQKKRFFTTIQILSFFFSSRRRHTSYIGDWSSDVCSSDLYHRVPPSADAGSLMGSRKRLQLHHPSHRLHVRCHHQRRVAVQDLAGRGRLRQAKSRQDRKSVV